MRLRRIRFYRRLRTNLNYFLEKGGKMAVSSDLLKILACPKCKTEVHLNEAGDGLICSACNLLYEIKDDIPIMLIDEAKPLD
jgi:uncharacterized protein YbaR (Trm112 family)